MCGLLSACGSRGDVEPRVGLAVQLRAFGAEVPVCARRTSRSCWSASARRCAGRPAGAPAGDRGGAAVGGGPAPARGRVGRRQFGTVAATAEGCDAPVATGVMPAGVCL